MTEWRDELELAKEAVLAATVVTEFVREQSAEPEAIAKGDRTPVTLADYGSQAMICREIARACPEDRIMAEEHSRQLLAGEGFGERLVQILDECEEGAHGLDDLCGWIDAGRDRRSDRCWILDPIDGTKGFLRGDQYAIALGLMVEERLVLGVLACPALPYDADHRGCLLFAHQGRGARMAPLWDPESSREIETSEAMEPADLVFVESVESAHADLDLHRKLYKQLGVKGEPLRMDSQAKYAAVARGDAAVYLRLPSPHNPGYKEKAWDHAAGLLILQEAGGCGTDIHGDPLDFSRGERLAANTGVLASNGRCHKRLVDAIEELRR